MSVAFRIRETLAEPFGLPPSYDRPQFIRSFVGAASRRLQVRLGRYQRLTRLASRYRSDKGITVFPFHGFTLFYDELFRDFQDRDIQLLEIGLAKRNLRVEGAPDAPSLSMWLDYFPKARVVGFDIDDFSGVHLPRTTIFQGDQGNLEDLGRMIEACGAFDVIIDDASHASWHQQRTLEALFPRLKSGGLYVIEDLHWQPPGLEASLPPARKTLELLRDWEALIELVPDVVDVRFFHSPIRIREREDMGALAVLRKR